MHKASLADDLFDPLLDEENMSAEENMDRLDISTLQERVAQDEAKALFELGSRYHDGRDVLKDTEKAVFYHEQAAKQGFTIAQYLLGQMYYDGDGVLEDHKKAFFYYRQAAKQGYSLAEYYLAKMYQEGDGVLENAEKAAEWLGRVFQRGDFELKVLLHIIESSERDRKIKPSSHKSSRANSQSGLDQS